MLNKSHSQFNTLVKNYVKTFYKLSNISDFDFMRIYEGYDCNIEKTALELDRKPSDIEKWICSIENRLNIKSLKPNLTESKIIAALSNSYSYTITEKGRKNISRKQYEKLLEHENDYDMFIDGVRDNRPCYKKEKGRIKRDCLTPIQFAIIKEYIETGKPRFPGATNAVKEYRHASREVKEESGGRLDKDKLSDESARDYFEDARRMVDVNLGRGKGFRAFKRGVEISPSTPPDTYQFKPPPGLKYILICPIETTPSNLPVRS
ncbi:MAG: hypothetical protein AB1599_00910 [Planctomycetota bacterium]